MKIEALGLTSRLIAIDFMLYEQLIMVMCYALNNCGAGKTNPTILESYIVPAGYTSSEIQALTPSVEVFLLD